LHIILCNIIFDKNNDDQADLICNGNSSRSFIDNERFVYFINVIVNIYYSEKCNGISAHELRNVGQNEMGPWHKIFRCSHVAREHEKVRPIEFGFVRFGDDRVFQSRVHYRNGPQIQRPCHKSCTGDALGQY